jgi:hypothetical protein
MSASPFREINVLGLVLSWSMRNRGANIDINCPEAVLQCVFLGNAPPSAGQRMLHTERFIVNHSTILGNVGIR